MVIGEAGYPVMVQFAKPQTWIVGRTSVDKNGEAGTVSANGGMISIPISRFIESCGHRSYRLYQRRFGIFLYE
jgi:hypothetical protein